MRRIAGMLFVLLAAAGADAAEIALFREGVSVEGEVCRFAAGDEVNPFRRWFSPGELTCESGASASIPKGLWNVFARSGGFVSAPRLVDGDRVPERLTFDLARGATLTASLPSNRRAVAYLPLRAIAYPLSGEAIVPAGEPLWLMSVEGTKIVGVDPLAALEAGNARSVDLSRESPGAVLGWLQVPQAAAMTVAPPLRVFLESERREYEADRLPGPDVVDGAIVRIAGITRGPATIVAGGGLWISQSRSLTVEDVITVVEQPLLARAGAAISVSWSTPDDLQTLDRSIASCQPVDPVTLELAVSQCSGDCSVVRTERYPLSARRGDLTLQGVLPGIYRAELRFGKLPPVTSSATAAAFRTASLSLFADYDEVSGVVTRGGKPFQARTMVELGALGAGFASEGDYRAIVSGPIPPETEITLTACSGSVRAKLLTDRKILPGSSYDIDIPLNELTVNPIDTFTRMAVSGVTVRYTLMSKIGRPRVVMTGSVTAPAGSSRILLGSLPPREIRLRVSHPEYETKTIAPFTLGDEETKTIDAELMPLRGDRGRVVSQRPFQNAVIIWFASDGRQTEQAELAPDGTFVSAGGHTGEESMTIVSTSHPLWIAPAPQLDPRKPIEIAFPDAAAVRSFDVSLKSDDPRASRHFGLIVGGLRVPLAALRMHMEMRRLPIVLRGSAPLAVRDIAATGPIDVTLGPEPEWLRGLRMDPFFADPFVRARRAPLGEGSLVVLKPTP